MYNNSHTKTRPAISKCSIIFSYFNDKVGVWCAHAASQPWQPSEPPLCPRPAIPPIQFFYLISSLTGTPPFRVLPAVLVTAAVGGGRLTAPAPTLRTGADMAGALARPAAGGCDGEFPMAVPPWTLPAAPMLFPRTERDLGDGGKKATKRSFGRPSGRCRSTGCSLGGMR